MKVLETHLISDAFEDLAHSLRVLLEADAKAHRFGLLNLDRAEAVGNIETGLASILNAFHSLYDAMSKEMPSSQLNWYDIPELAIILTLRNARHHNLSKKIRTMYSYYAQEAEKIGQMEMYILIDFPCNEPGADTFNVYISWADLKSLLDMPPKVTRIQTQVAESIKAYLSTKKFNEYSRRYQLEENRVFFNVIPLIVNAAIKIIPFIKDRVTTRSMESETYLTLFQYVQTADTHEHEVIAGPIVLMA